MTRRTAAVILLLITVICGGNFVVAKTPKVEKITGQIVAYSDFPPACLNGNGYWSMLIRVRDRHGQQHATGAAQYVQVDFSMPCDQSPQWLMHNQTPRIFRLVRLEPHANLPLREFTDCSGKPDGTCVALPLWKRVPGAEQESLPFGQHVESYRSIDLHLAPVL